MRNVWKSVIWGLIGSILFLREAADIHAAIPQKALQVSMGSQHAPLTIIMYYSLTCPHCQDFQEKVLPEIKKQYVDKGLVHFIIRDFPTDGLALAATKVAWCLGKDHYLRISKKLLETQDTWAYNPSDPKNPLEDLHKVALQCGLNAQICQKCLSNKDFEDTVIRESFEAQKNYVIDYAPAFIINDKLYKAPLTPEAIGDMLTTMGIHWRDSKSS
jgi:protein-disulfide isomerase